MQIKPVRPVVLIVLDGWGSAPAGSGNAISLAHKPHWDNLYNSFPHTSLGASGEAVGLPAGEAGNSEVGHLNLGAGRIVYQELPRINQAISNKTFSETPAFQAVLRHIEQTGGNLNLMGLIGQGVVHSSLDHLYALLDLCKARAVKKVNLHLFIDGRDSSPKNALQTLSEVEDRVRQSGVGRIASVMGRYWAMDRDNRWERTERAYRAMTEGIGFSTTDLNKAIGDSYQKNITDEFIEPIIVPDSSGKVDVIKEGDGVIFFNFRPDRARQITKAFVEPGFGYFQNHRELKNLFFVSMVSYEKGLAVSAVAFPDVQVSLPLAQIVSQSSLRQLHIGETEKYAHVTYFFNGSHEDPYPEEDRVHIPSPKVETYDQKPQMSASAISEYVVSHLHERAYDFYLVNFANADMVAHTGSIPATIKAIEAVDACLGSIANAVQLAAGALVVTADHGNAEVMINPQNQQADTEHSTNPVPAIFISDQLKERPNKVLQSGVLADVAPTVLSLLGITLPSIMTGRNLLVED